MTIPVILGAQASRLLRQAPAMTIPGPANREPTVGAPRTRITEGMSKEEIPLGDKRAA